MSIDHNRIRVSDLEKNQPNKILSTDQNGELGFTDINSIKTDSYNALDYNNEGKALDARQGKVLKDLIDNLNVLLASENVNLNTFQELVDAIETLQNSLNNILLNAPSIEKTTIKDDDRIVIDDSETSFTKKSVQFLRIKSILKIYFDTFYKKLQKTIIPNTSISYTFKLSDALDDGMIIHSSSSSITETIPNNSTVAFPIGSVIESVATGTGIRTTIGASGVTLLTNIGISSVKNEVRRFTKIDTNTWLIGGNIIPEARVKGAYFVSASGNDSTAQYENGDKPYLTLDAAITAFLANPNALYIQILTASTFSINIAINNGTTRAFDLRSDAACTVNVITTSVYVFNLQPFNVNIPNGNIYFNPTVASANGFNNAIVNIKASLIEFSATYQAGTGNSSEASLISNTLNVKIINSGGIFQGSGGNRKINIKTNTLNFRGATYLVGAFMNLTLDFDNLTHDNTFLISAQAFTASTIYHGNISSIAPYVNTTNFNYISGTNLIINFKGIASISSNISINRFNTNGSCVITGIANFPNSNQLIGGGNNTLGLVFINANITVKSLISSMNLTKLIRFSNCTITLLGGYFANYIESTHGITYDDITADFIGNNYIITATDGANITYDEPYWNSANQPTWNIKNGILFTNGVISSGVNILRRNLNQYNSASIIA